MTIDELRKWRDAKPFEAFVLQLNDGTELGVGEPDDLGIPPVKPDHVWVAIPNSGSRPIGLSVIASIRKAGRPKRRRAG